MHCSRGGAAWNARYAIGRSRGFVHQELRVVESGQRLSSRRHPLHPIPPTSLPDAPNPLPP
eukprot:8213149-Prorocentrum_lima.AAC.1